MDAPATHPAKRNNVLHQTENISFSFYKTQDIRKLSVRQIYSPVAFDSLQRPVRGGLYDPALGVLDRSVTKLCATCHLGYADCPGHFGHIELALPVVHPVLFPLLIKVLRAKCWYCHHFRLGTRTKKLFIAKLRFLFCNEWEKAEEVDEIMGMLSSADDQKKQHDRLSEEGEQQNEETLMNDTNLEVEVASGLSSSFSSMESRIESQIKAREEQLCEEAYAVWKSFMKKHSTRKAIQSYSSNCALLRKRTTEEFLASNESLGKCQNCGHSSVVIRREESKVFRILKKSQESEQVDILVSQSRKEETSHIERDSSYQETHSVNKKLISTIELEQQLSRLYQIEMECIQVLWEMDAINQTNDSEQQQNNNNETVDSVFFIRCLAVSPCRFRPPATFSEGEQLLVMEHPQNVFLTRILQINQQLIQLKEQQESSSILSPIQQMIALQHAVNQLYDCSRGGVGANAGTTTGTGIRQQLEHKEGLFRMYMMGKRVNHSARSVISPDPFLETCEVGVPESFAMKLTFPEPINFYNIEYLRKAIIRGSTEYPGATGIEDRMGNVIDFLRAPEHQRKAQAMSLKSSHPMNLDMIDRSAADASASIHKAMNHNAIIRVYRHMKNGDLVLFNRQPSLHRVSILAHKVRILPGERTIRMHYANCQSYNADFDGDEMNLHFPQDYVAQSEAFNLLLTDRHYISPTNGNPLRGLIQDHILGGVLLTSIDTFLRLDEFQQLLYGAIERTMESVDNKTVAIPTPAIVFPVPLWTGKQVISTILLFLIGSRPPFYLQSNNKLKWEMVGDDDQVIVHRGHLLRGVLDKSQFGASAHGLVHSFYEIYGAIDAGRLLSALGRLFTLFLRIHGHTTGVDDLLLTTIAEMKRKEWQQYCEMSFVFLATEQWIEKLMERGLLSEESLSILLGTGDWKSKLKGSELNYSQLLLLYGRILGNMESDVTSRAEMESLLDEIVKKQVSKVTSEVIKSCISDREGVVKKFPHNGFLLMTSSGAKGSLVNTAQISCQLGQTELEGKRVPRSLSGATLPCYPSFDPCPQSGGFIASRFLTGIRPDEYFYHCMAGRDGLVDTAVKTARSGYLQRCLVKGLEDLYVGYDYTVRQSENQAVIQFLYGEDGLDPCRTAWLSKPSCFQWHAWNIEALQSTLYSQHRSYQTVDYALSPKFQHSLHQFMKECGESLPQNRTKEQFQSFMESRYRNAFISPGEAVGVIAAQGVGEPSTQMTLNTFHFAGMGAAHVTLGIPRLRELLMTASKQPKTPLMTIPFLSSTDKKGIQLLHNRFHRLVLKDFLEGISIEDKGNRAQGRLVMIELHLVPPHYYATHLGISAKELFHTIETHFLAMLHARIQKECKQVSETKKAIMPLQSLSMHWDSDGMELDKPSLQEERDIEKEGNKKKGKFSMNTSAEMEEVNGDDKDEEEEEDLSWNEEDGTIGEKRDRQQRDVTSYEEEEEEEEQEEEEEKEEEEEEYSRSDIRKVNQSSTQEPINFEEKKKITFDREQYRRAKIPLMIPFTSWGRLMLFELVESVAQQACVQNIPGIQRCSLITPSEDSQDWKLEVQGSNLAAIWEYGYDYLDLNHIQTNDVYAMLMHYGVESARETLRIELAKVFGAYGIPVDSRHLALISDVMTCQGDYQPFNRRGMEKRCCSTIQKASFETTMKFILDAAFHQQTDNIHSPSSRLAVGRTVGYGTGEGIFTLRQRLPVA
ncbi:DNA-directed RNA polymerase I subunit rpa1 [Galdieria sulphuraria]|nr:DNA-directed RNA polymerase I subunit rpa1 [Galdieria sulphuraria]